MSWETTLSALGISAGAALMAVSIARFGGLMGRASYIRDGDERSVLLRYLGVHRILMVFFLVGYLVVLTGIVTGIHGTFGGQLFIALIFLCGAIFVFVGLQLQDRMLRGVIAEAEQRLESETAQRRATEATLALGKERDLSRLKEEFLASLSHELRTPLNAVLGLSEALLENTYGSLEEEQANSVRTIRASGEKLLAMFDDLLDFARIGAGRYPTELAPVDLRSCVNAVLRRQKRAAADADVTLQADIDELDAVVIVDVRHVQRILMNLVDNAIKFTAAGGMAGIRLRESERSGWIELQVWDTGIGISAEKQERLFRPFVQVEGGLSRRYGGTGLGLALTSRLAQLVGAELEVNSVKGKGTTFVLLVSRRPTRHLTVYADLRCPFCFVLNEWLEDAHLSHTVRWRGVEQRPGLTREEGASDEMQHELDEELARLSDLAPEIDVQKPEQVSNTRRALAAVERVRRTQPWRTASARTRLYRAIWQQGVDVTEWEQVRAVLSDFDLGDLDDDAPEMLAVIEATTEWRDSGEDRIPMLSSLANTTEWHGLGMRGDLMTYVEEQVRGQRGHSPPEE